MGPCRADYGFPHLSKLCQIGVAPSRRCPARYDCDVPLCVMCMVVRFEWWKENTSFMYEVHPTHVLLVGAGDGDVITIQGDGD